MKPYGGNVDYKSIGVTKFCVDVIINEISFPRRSACDGLTLFLLNDNGTPDDRFDDWGAVTDTTDILIQPGDGWQKACFNIPAQSQELPFGWDIRSEGGAPEPDLLPPNATWQNAIADVDRIQFLFGRTISEPCGSIDQFWDFGFDNLTVFVGDEVPIGIPALSITGMTVLSLWVALSGGGVARRLRRRC